MAIGKKDGSVVIDTLLLTKGFDKGVANMQKSMSGLIGTVGKIGAAVGVAFGVKALVDFGKEAIELGSDLEEVQNVVDVTFGAMSYKIDEFAKNAVKQFGLSELAAKQYSSTMGAMLKSMRLDNNSVLEISTKLAGLAGDIASFYNLTNEEAFTKLRAGISGETEPLKQLGINLSVANLEAFALAEGITKSYNAMTEQEKVLLRYNYILKTTADAQGDFARTSNSWANQTRILAEQFNSLKSVLGQSFINMFKPIISGLNAVISKIIDFAETVSNALGKIFGWKFETSGGISSDLEEGAGYAGNLSDEMSDAEGSAKKLKNHLLGIDELNVLNQDSESSGTGIGSGSSGGNAVGEWVPHESILEEFKSEIDSLYELGNYIRDALIGAMESIDWESVYEKARNFGSGLAEYLNGLLAYDGEGRTLFGELGKTLANTLNTVIYASLEFAKEFDFYQFGVNLADGINRFFQNFDFATLAESINKWVDGLKETIRGFLEKLKWEDIINGIGDFLSTLELDTVTIIVGSWLFKSLNTSNLLTKLMESIFGKGVASIIPGVGKGITAELGLTIALDYFFASKAKPEGMDTGEFQYWRNEQINATNYVDSQSFIDTFTLIKDYWSSIWGTTEGEERINATNYIDSKSFFETIDLLKIALGNFKDSIAMWWDESVQPWFTVEKWQELFNNIQLAIGIIWENFLIWWNETALAQWWENDVQPWFTLEKWQELFNTIKESLMNKWQEVTTWWKLNIKKWWDESVQPWFTKERWLKLGENLKNGIYEGFKGIANKVIGVLNNVISALEGLINRAIEGINSMLSKIGETPLGETLGWDFKIGNVSFGRIPYLATGAVIPPNAPFLAMLGDQKHGNNIEAPEDLIRKIVREESGLNSEVIALLTEIVRNTRETADKDFGTYIDGRELVSAYDNRKARNGFAF